MPGGSFWPPVTVWFALYQGWWLELAFAESSDQITRLKPITALKS